MTTIRRRRAAPSRTRPRSRWPRTRKPCARGARAMAPPDDRSNARTWACTTPDTERRAVIDAHERSATDWAAPGSSWRERPGPAQPTVDTRHVAARPRAQQHSRRNGNESAWPQGRRPSASGRGQLSVYGTRSGPAAIAPSAVTISATAAPIPLRAPKSGVTSIATVGVCAEERTGAGTAVS
jgi:hypothetical protein